MVVDLQLPMQSVPITTKVVSLNPVIGEVYSIQHYVIKFISDLQRVDGFLLVLRFPPPINLTATTQLKHHNPNLSQRHHVVTLKAYLWHTLSSLWRMLLLTVYYLSSLKIYYRICNKSKDMRFIHYNFISRLPQLQITNLLAKKC